MVRCSAIGLKALEEAVERAVKRALAETRSKKLEDASRAVEVFTYNVGWLWSGSPGLTTVGEGTASMRAEADSLKKLVEDLVAAVDEWSSKPGTVEKVTLLSRLQEPPFNNLL